MQVEYELKPSAIAGTGIFTTAQVKRGTLLWLCDAQSTRTHDEASPRKRPADLPRDAHALAHRPAARFCLVPADVPRLPLPHVAARGPPAPRVHLGVRGRRAQRRPHALAPAAARD